MPTHGLSNLSMNEAARLVREREVSPSELTQACITRAEALESKIHAYITETFDAALAEAKAATEEIAAGRYRGPLHGIPFALKDLYETAGVRTTAGSPLRDQYVPTEDAHVVTLLKRAGVVLLGKLNMHEWSKSAGHRPSKSLRGGCAVLGGFDSLSLPPPQLVDRRRARGVGTAGAVP